jgi:hypothetical protein
LPEEKKLFYKIHHLTRKDHERNEKIYGIDAYAFYGNHSHDHWKSFGLIGTGAALSGI